MSDESVEPSETRAIDSESRAAVSLRLSQAHLTLLTTCPRKFQHVFLDKLGAPNSLKQQERLNQGTQFHLLVQQWLMELPIAPLLQSDRQLRQWFEAFEAAAPTILSSVGGDTRQQPESDRTLSFAGYLLTARYDLLLLSQQSARILDWKTYPRPQNPQWLQQNWQTRLYLFLLAEADAYLPHQLAMVYWFFQTSQSQVEAPQSLAFKYTLHQHEQTRQELTQLLHQLSVWLQRYQVGEAFPQQPFGAPQCEACSFAVRCDRPIVQASTTSATLNTLAQSEDLESLTLDTLFAIDTIAEVPI